MNVVLCTINLVITSNLIRKITLNMLCSVPCCEVQQIFFFWLSMGRRWAGRTLNFKEVSYKNGNLHNHCSDNHEPNSKDNSVPCCEVQQIFFLTLHGKTLVYKNLNFKQVSYESGTLHKYCSDNLEPNSKDNSEYSVLCSLLRGSTFFFLALHGKALGYKRT